MKHIIISLLYLLTLFCLSEFVFNPAYLYYEIWWLDIPMHIMGGFGVASLAGAILSYKGIKVSYMKLFMAYMTIAVTWEVYEHVLNYMNLGTWYGDRLPRVDIIDTVKDIFNGFLGMSFAYLFVRR
jgi:hypothetical protein